MKKVIYIFFAFASLLTLASCEKKDYPRGVAEMEHHYYAVFVPNNNTSVSVNKTQTTLLKFPVQFYSVYTRDYDAIAKYSVVTTDPANAAVLGKDFNIVDKNGAVISSNDGVYTMTFPQAKQATDTIYIKLLNNPAPGTRKVEIQLLENKTDKFYVDIFSTAFKRPLDIK